MTLQCSTIWLRRRSASRPPRFGSCTSAANRWTREKSRSCDIPIPWTLPCTRAKSRCFVNAETTRSALPQTSGIGLQSLLPCRIPGPWSLVSALRGCLRRLCWPWLACGPLFWSADRTLRRGTAQLHSSGRPGYSTRNATSSSVKAAQEPFPTASSTPGRGMNGRAGFYGSWCASARTKASSGTQSPTLEPTCC